MNVEIGTVATQFLFGRIFIPFLGIFVANFLFWFFAVNNVMNTVYHLCDGRRDAKTRVVVIAVIRYWASISYPETQREWWRNPIEESELQSTIVFA
jgi:drug/metabolite transporter superfamily protein YnfA